MVFNNVIIAHYRAEVLNLNRVDALECLVGFIFGCLRCFSQLLSDSVRSSITFLTVIVDQFLKLIYE